MTKTHPSERLWRRGIQKVFFYFALLLPFCLLNGCSSDDGEADAPPPSTSTPYAEVGNNNKNMPSGGTIVTQYSDSPSEFDIGKLVDGNVKTSFLTYHSEFFITWNGNKTAVVNNYTLTSGSDVAEQDPKSWSLYGSNDNKEWKLLDTQTNQMFSKREEKKEYQFENEVAYKSYRLDIKSNNGGKATRISELTMQKVDPPLDPEKPYSVVVDSRNLNMPSGGIITSEFSDFPSGTDVGKLVDGSANTKFITYHNKFYILWEGDKSATVNYYSIISAADAPEKDPKSWTLYGSNDNRSWTSIDAQNELLFSGRKQKMEFLLDNTVAYKYYKLEILSNNGGSATQIAEWTMQEIPTDIEDLMRYSSGSSYSPSTPMGNHYANRHVTTEEDIAWLNVAENEPPVPGSASSLHLANFNVTLYPYGTPLPADVNQHAIGDCSALAVFASMAYIYPNFVKSLIKDNKDRTYTVSMYDPQGKPITVTVTSKFLAGSNGNLEAITGKNNVATWATVLEKAIMKYNCRYKVNEDIGGIGSEHVAPLFTGEGNSFAFDRGRLNATQLARAVKVCLTQGKIVVGGFHPGGLKIGNLETVTAHAYTLMHSKDRTALFTMRNPWGFSPGSDGGKEDGILNIPNDNVIPPTIDLRIIDPGKASEFGTGVFEPYSPPSFAAKPQSMPSYLLRR